MTTPRTIATVALLTCIASPAGAQTPSGPSSPKIRGYLSIDGGFQAATSDFDSRGTFTQNVEEARFDAAHEVKPGPQFQGGGGIGVWRHVYAGVAISRFSRSTPVRVTGSIPHPFFFSQNRSIEGDVAGLRRDEMAVHVHARAVLAPSPRLNVALFGGPSWFTVKQGIVGGVQYNESYPYDTAEFRSATTHSPSESRIGFHAGGDVAFFFTRHFGIGGAVQFARAELELPAQNAGTVTVTAGGIQGGAGLRVRF